MLRILSTRLAPAVMQQPLGMAARAFSAEAGTLTGTVKFFNRRKGWGFITVDVDPLNEPTYEVFVHQRDVRRDGFRFLDEGERVSFVVEESERGGQAKEVGGEDGSPLAFVPPGGGNRDDRY